MRSWSQGDIDSLIGGFQNRSLTQEIWTHEAHLLVACYYIHTFSADEALIFLRSGIISLNISMGVENTSQGGYHETLTCFWHWVITHYISKQEKDLTISELCNRFLRSSCADKRLPLAFYTKDYLFNIKSRATFVAPDLQALDIDHLTFD